MAYLFSAAVSLSLIHLQLEGLKGLSLTESAPYLEETLAQPRHRGEGAWTSDPR